MRQDNTDKKHKMTVKILIIVVAILVLFIAFVYIAKPEMQKYDAKRQTEGINYVVGSILNSINSTGYVGIPVGKNQTVNLVPVQACKQIIAQQSQQAQNEQPANNPTK